MREPHLELPAAPGGPAAAEQPATFVVSDIESSTRRWESDPGGMAKDLALHDELLRTVFEDASGEVFSHTGDGLWAAFTSPLGAFEAAMAGQRTLLTAPWTGPLRVRMAIHTGVAERRVGNYFGLPLNRAARLLAVASGGQLCSQAAGEAVGSDLPGDVALIDLGEHRLAGWGRSVAATAGEPVSDLAGSDAVWLFLERARAARPRFELTAGNAPAVARICCRLDGIPLAVELAAARIRALSVEQVAARLDDCFGLLTGDARTAVSRHQTLRATLDWSYQLLEPQERFVLRQLSVFPADFDIDAAEAIGAAPLGPVGGDPIDGVDLISRLVDKSLIAVIEEGDDVRYRLLESVRQYAGEKLAAEAEAADAARRHHDHYLALVDGWGTQVINQFMWPLRLVAAEQENLRTALEWAWREGDLDAALRLICPQATLWLWGGHFQGYEWAERVVNEAKDRHVRISWAVVAQFGMLLHTFGRASPEVCGGAVPGGGGNRDPGRGRDRCGLRPVDPRFVPIDRRTARRGPGTDADRARMLAEEAIRSARSLPGRMILVMALARAAEAAVLARDRPRAARTLTELLELLRDLQARRWMADALELVAVLADAAEVDEQAARFFGASAALRDALGENLGGVRVVAAEVRRCRERVERALGERFAEHEGSGRMAPTDETIAEALTGLAQGWSS
ncbi:MAG: adenylate/guanylate cyclase domain-containing protein [Actinobacteria bacterium]|nr:adenylate/guanylate cyclase domain-containing protein [Actinomycetota bacterium]